MKELAADGIPVAVTCRVLKLARQPCYRWLANPITDAEFEAADAGEPMAERTAWRICSINGWCSAFGKSVAKTPGPARSCTMI